ncbi:DNA primase [Beduini massiliensis]|uniref:DNA primase n=1 Tax=Beduini massiliensis TaxID=1585974 RepID=UPI00059A922C|nr:DNA primase [Beduini massiliensis]
MARLSDAKISEILQSVDIVDVISLYLPLQKKGKDYKAVCPFHNDTNPSLSISPARQIYKCFVCGAGGNAFTFLQEYLNISYLEAVKKVAEIGGIDVSELNFNTPTKKVDEKLVPLYTMHDEANKIYRHLLHTKTGLAAHEYLQSRHINDSLIEEFDIGYAGRDNQLYMAFQNLAYKEVDMVRSGLIIDGEHGAFDRYRDRVMFALHDADGKVIGFSGRVYRSNTDESKYMNSPESEIFIKSRTLYHYHKAKEPVKKAGFVYLLEGFMDVIALSRIGIDNTLAIMGTALTNEHMNMIRKLSNNVYLCLDGDRAGQSAAIKSAKLLLEHQFNVKMIKLMDGMDPDEILEQFGEETLRIALTSTMDPIEFEIQHLYENTNMANHEETREFIQRSCQLIANMTNPIDRQYYIEMIATRSNSDQNVIKEFWQSLQTNKVVRQPVISPVVRNDYKRLDKYQKAERHLLFYMLHDKKVCDLYEQKIGFMFDDMNRIIASYIVDYYRTKEKMTIASFISYIQNTKMVEYVLEIMDENLPEEVEMKVIEDYIETIKINTQAKEIEQLKLQMANELDALKKAELAVKILEIQKN